MLKKHPFCGAFLVFWGFKFLSMNILYTESSPNIGGQELQAIAQMCAIRRLGHQVMLACREHSRITPKRIGKSILEKL
ncbi:hypothetical protein QDX09_26710 (plasmid) [Escherichia coli]|nr:hypothetical protein [Escherichia coli]WHG00355.1 hypothetical protein QDX09_26710 [Escherichia coli]